MNGIRWERGLLEGGSPLIKDLTQSFRIEYAKTVNAFAIPFLKPYYYLSCLP